VNVSGQNMADTSLEAFANRKKSQPERALVAITSWGWQGATQEEVSRQTGIPRQSLCRCFIALEARGQIVRLTAKKIGSLGAPMHQYVAASQFDATIHTRYTPRAA
jgi:hypothetical protein